MLISIVIFTHLTIRRAIVISRNQYGLSDMIYSFSNKCGNTVSMWYIANEPLLPVRKKDIITLKGTHPQYSLRFCVNENIILISVTGKRTVPEGSVAEE